MKKYQVLLKNLNGSVLYTHNLYAKDNKDAEQKARTCFDACLDKSVLDYSFNLKN